MVPCYRVYGNGPPLMNLLGMPWTWVFPLRPPMFDPPPPFGGGHGRGKKITPGPGAEGAEENFFAPAKVARTI